MCKMAEYLTSWPCARRKYSNLGCLNSTAVEVTPGVWICLTHANEFHPLRVCRSCKKETRLMIYHDIKHTRTQNLCYDCALKKDDSYAFKPLMVLQTRRNSDP